MNNGQRRLIVALLIGIGFILAFVFLEWGEGAFSSMDGRRIAILVLYETNPKSVFGSGYGLYTMQGVPGILLGLILPLCLFAGAAFIALGSRAREKS